MSQVMSVEASTSTVVQTTNTESQESAKKPGKWIHVSNQNSLKAVLKEIQTLQTAIANQNDPNWTLHVKAALVASVALTAFTLLDMTQLILQAGLRLAVVTLKQSIAQGIGFQDQIPDTLNWSDFVGLVQRIYNCVVLTLASAIVGLWSPSTVLSIAQHFTYVDFTNMAAALPQVATGTSGQAAPVTLAVDTIAPAVKVN